MSGSDWKTTPAVTLGEASLSPHNLLVRLHLRRRLVPLLREAVAEEFLRRQAKQAGLSVPAEALQQAASVTGTASPAPSRRRHGSPAKGSPSRSSNRPWSATCSWTGSSNT